MERKMFSVTKTASHALSPRLGELVLPRRKVISTPHYLAVSSRGVVPHITQDNLVKHTEIGGIYAALEDFVERDDPPVYHFKPPGNGSPIRRFTALPEDHVLVLGARRTPPVIAPAANPNTDTYVAICTSVGFKPLSVKDFIVGSELLKADIVVSVGDIPYGRALGSKRIEKATDRMIQFINDHVNHRRALGDHINSRLFAPVLPVPVEKQQFYIECLAEDVNECIDGLAVYSLDGISGLPPKLQALPRLGFTVPATPHNVLEHVASGIDVLTLPFVSEATDAGIAFTFKFRPYQHSKNSQATPVPLGFNLWSTSNAVALSPLDEGCLCYACTHHHRAYIHHLLNAKEMLAWVLLQIHNHHIMDLFFADIRTSIAESKFEQNRSSFQRSYEPTLPQSTGQGPRIRGYHLKSEGPGESKKNKAPFTTVNNAEESLAEAGPPTPSIDAKDLEEQGFAERK